MSQSTSHHFDLETVALLRHAVEDAWACLKAVEREQITRSLLAERILKAAARGERGRGRLVEAALDEKVAA
jgi:hypothetical protein